MKYRMESKIAATIVLCGVFGVLFAPGCDTLGLGGDGGSGGSGGEADAFAEVDPQELAHASLKASAVSYYLAGLIASSGLDPSNVDAAALEELMQQNAPEAEAAVGEWLTTIDSSAVELAGKEPKYECTDKFQCPYRTKCLNAPFKSLKHACYVNDCGSAKCTDCPNWWPDFLKTLLWKSWCAYVCIESNVPYPKIVAVGAGAVTHFGDAAVGPWCLTPP